MVFDRSTEIVLKFSEGLAAIGDIFIDEQDFAKEGIVRGVHLDCAMISFMYDGFLCQLFCPF